MVLHQANSMTRSTIPAAAPRPPPLISLSLPRYTRRGWIPGVDLSRTCFPVRLSQMTVLISSDSNFFSNIQHRCQRHFTVSIRVYPRSESTMWMFCIKRPGSVYPVGVMPTPMSRNCNHCQQVGSSAILGKEFKIPRCLRWFFFPFVYVIVIEMPDRFQYGLPTSTSQTRDLADGSMDVNNLGPGIVSGGLPMIPNHVEQMQTLLFPSHNHTIAPQPYFFNAADMPSSSPSQTPKEYGPQFLSFPPTQGQY